MKEEVRAYAHARWCAQPKYVGRPTIRACSWCYGQAIDPQEYRTTRRVLTCAGCNGTGHMEIVYPE